MNNVWGCVFFFSINAGVLVLSLRSVTELKGCYGWRDWRRRVHGWSHTGLTPLMPAYVRAAAVLLGRGALAPGTFRGWGAAAGRGLQRAPAFTAGLAGVPGVCQGEDRVARRSPEWGEGCWGCVTTRASACGPAACLHAPKWLPPASPFPQPVSRQLYFQPPAAVSLMSLPRDAC